MAVSEAKRATNDRWDAANMVTLGCRMRRTLADEFREACREAGTNPNAVFRAAIDEFMQRHKERRPEDI